MKLIIDFFYRIDWIPKESNHVLKSSKILQFYLDFLNKVLIFYKIYECGCRHLIYFEKFHQKDHKLESKAF